MTLRIRLFTQLQLTDGNQEGTFSIRPRAKRLLVYLLLHRNETFLREHLSFSLWPDRPERDSLGTLRRALSELRRSLPTLEEGQWIVDSQDGIRWNLNSPYWLDIEIFEQLTSEATIFALHEAATLYTGDLLNGWYDDWVLVESVRLNQIQRRNLRQLIAHHRLVGDLETAIDLAQQLLILDPLSETDSRDLIGLLYEVGDRAAALTEHNRIVSKLRDDLGVEPMEETEMLRRAIVEGAALPTEGKTPSISNRGSMPDRPKLIGRENETDTLTELWKATVSGHGQLVLVSGEAGVGKSHLVHSLADNIANQGGLALVGHCYEFEQSLPLQAIVTMLRPASSLLQRMELAPVHRSTLTYLLPDIFGAGASWSKQLDASERHLRFQLFEALLQAFLAIERSHPLLLIIEDIQWVAESTLDWLTYIIPRLGANRLLIVITYRTTEVDSQHVVSRLSRRFGDGANYSHISLHPLSTEANRKLVAHLAGLDVVQTTTLADRLFAKSGGNPLFLREMVRGLIEMGQIEVRDGRWTDASLAALANLEIQLPDSLRRMISDRVDRLSDTSRAIIRTAAVAGKVFHYDIVRKAGNIAEGLALESLEELLTLGFLKSSKEEGYFSFSHHLVQEAIYASLISPRRNYVHRHLARATQALQPNNVETLFHHFMAAGDHQKASEYALHAARRAEAVYAYEEAVTYRLIALKQMKPQDNLELRLTLMEELADDYHLLRKGLKAVSTYYEALELWQGSSHTDPFITMRLCRKILHTTASMRGTNEFAQFELATRIRINLQQTLDTILSPRKYNAPNEELIRLKKAVAKDALTRFPPDWEMAQRYAREAVEMAELLDKPVILSSALSTLASVYGARGMVRERVDIASQQLDLSRDPRFDNPRERIRALHGIGNALIHAGEYVEAIPYLRQAEKQASDIGAVSLQSLAMSLLHQCWFRLDRWDEMIKNDEKREKLLQEYSLEQVGSPCFSMALSAVIHALRGDFERAEHLRKESYAIMAKLAGPPERWMRNSYY